MKAKRMVTAQRNAERPGSRIERGKARPADARTTPRRASAPSMKAYWQNHGCHLCWSACAFLAHADQRRAREPPPAPRQQRGGQEGGEQRPEQHQVPGVGGYEGPQGLPRRRHGEQGRLPPGAPLRRSGRRRASAETLRTASNPRLPVTSANARQLGRLAVGGWRKGQG